MPPSFVKKALTKIQNIPDKRGKVVTALKVTGLIAKGVGCFVPCAGLVGSALSIGASLLSDPPPSELDVQKLEDVAQSLSDPSVISSLQKQIEDMNFRIENPGPDVRTDVENVQEDLLDILKEVKVENSKYEPEIAKIQGVVNLTFLIVVDIKYKEGIQRVDAAFKVFQSQTSLDEFKTFVFELQTCAHQYFEQSNIKEYLRLVFNHSGGKEACQAITHYIIIVLSKYLQMMAAYHVHKMDEDALAADYEFFNATFDNIMRIYAEVLGEKFIAGNLPVLECVAKNLEAYKRSSGSASIDSPDSVSRMNASFKSLTTSNPTDGRVSEFLRKLGLDHLIQLFLDQKFTMEDLSALTSTELIEIGVGQLKERRILLEAVENLKRKKVNPVPDTQLDQNDRRGGAVGGGGYHPQHDPPRRRVEKPVAVVQKDRLICSKGHQLHPIPLDIDGRKPWICNKCRRPSSHYHDVVVWRCQHDRRARRYSQVIHPLSSNGQCDYDVCNTCVSKHWTKRLICDSGHQLQPLPRDIGNETPWICDNCERKPEFHDVLAWRCQYDWRAIRGGQCDFDMCNPCVSEHVLQF